MPQLSDLLEKKKFTKKSYRPWDLSGTGTIDQSDKVEQPIQKSVTPEIEDRSTITKTEAKDSVKTLASPVSAIPNTGNITGNITGNNKVTIREQPANYEVTLKKQPDNNRVTTRQQPSNDLGNITGNNQSIHYLAESIKKLTGIQKNILLYVVNICSARGSLETGIILSLDLANAAGCSTGSAKTSLIRLIEKQLVIRHQGKACKGGHMILGITNEIQAASIQAQQALFNPLKTTLTDNITGNKTGNNVYSSSSSYINKDYTTTSLPDDWKKINFDMLEKVGFSETQLFQLLQSGKTTPEVVQKSINHFAYALQHKEKVKAYNDPLNVLMGVLRKGCDWNDADYVSPQEIALQNILEEKRQAKAKMEAMIKELVEFEFPDWKKKLTEEEVKQIVPEYTLKTNIAPAINATLRTYFTENVLLPKLKQQGLTDIS